MVRYAADWLVSNLQAEVHNATKVPLESIWFTFRGRPLPLDSTLVQAGVLQDSTVVARMRVSFNHNVNIQVITRYGINLPQPKY